MFVERFVFSEIGSTKTTKEHKGSNNHKGIAER